MEIKPTIFRGLGLTVEFNDGDQLKWTQELKDTFTMETGSMIGRLKKAQECKAKKGIKCMFVEKCSNCLK